MNETAEQMQHAIHAAKMELERIWEKIQDCLSKIAQSLGLAHYHRTVKPAIRRGAQEAKSEEAKEEGEHVILHFPPERLATPALSHPRFL